MHGIRAKLEVDESSMKFWENSSKLKILSKKIFDGKFYFALSESLALVLTLLKFFLSLFLQICFSFLTGHKALMFSTFVDFSETKAWFTI